MVFKRVHGMHRLIRLEFTSAFEMLDFVQVVNDHIGRGVGFDEDSIHWIGVAIRECVINAIKHGNRRDEKKKVHVEANVNSKQAEIVVEDEGPGFSRRSVPDPTLPENLEKCSGRGIHLIEAYVHEVEWSKGGRRVRMVIHDGPDVLPRG